jgi:hypothetical protein
MSAVRKISGDAGQYVGFTLKPNGFCQNPAMDLPPDRNSASRDNRDKVHAAADGPRASLLLHMQGD